MTDNDPYQPPATELQVPAQVGAAGEVLASRESRLGAAILDSCIIMAILVPLQWAMGAYDETTANSLVVTATWGGLGLLLTMLIQGYFLATRAQSLGKMALKIKIVTLDGANAEFSRIVLRRIVPVTVMTMIPFVGGIFSLVDSLFIFREDQRCIHDHIAGTRVVKT